MSTSQAAEPMKHVGQEEFERRAEGCHVQISMARRWIETRDAQLERDLEELMKKFWLHPKPSKMIMEAGFGPYRGKKRGMLLDWYETTLLADQLYRPPPGYISWVQERNQFERLTKRANEGKLDYRALNILREYGFVEIK